MNAGQFLIGVSGALVGVIGWLFVGVYIQKRAHTRRHGTPVEASTSGWSPTG